MTQTAEKSVMQAFENNVDQTGSKCVDFCDDLDEKLSTSDVGTSNVNNINKQPEQESVKEDESVDILTQEDAVNKFLTGDAKDELLMVNVNVDNNEGIDFKAENVITECLEIERQEHTEFSENASHQEDYRYEYIADSPLNYIAKTLKKRSIKCLNKMRIMEDVKEGCDVQPSSPGHAEQRVDLQEAPQDVHHQENGHQQEEVAEVVAAAEETSKDQPEVKLEHQTGDDDTLMGADTEQDAKSDKNCDSNHVSEDIYSNASSPENPSSTKRKMESEEMPSKKLRLDLHENFLSRDRILNEFMEIAECGSLDQIQMQSETILSEIKMLNEVAKEKEREWNNILHLKKLKEELLLRVQRRKQVLLMNDKSINDILWDGQNENTKNNFTQSILKTNLTNPQKSTLKIPNVDKNQTKFRTILPRPPQRASLDMNGSLDYRSGNRQRPILDVQSIIADYRQRNPEAVPRRGRRIRNHNFIDTTCKSSNGVMSFSSLALGSGATVRQNLDPSNEFGMLLNAMNEANRQEGSKLSGTESNILSSDGNNSSFKDMLVQFARLSQSERNELIQNAMKPPPPYPEVTVHPVPPATTTTSTPSNSLLHGILTKSPSKSNSKPSFSPTLARLLTAPERSVASHVTSTPISSTGAVNSSNVSISEILATSKARNEITITPVSSQYESSVKAKSHMEEEEAEDSADRLVIDESTEGDGRRGDSNSDAGDEVPQCQGCNQKPAQFVCAGCGNQWYCSRDCQVTAWDEHSEVCSG